jgi:ureidoacrylate peracid hydrolase
MKLRLSTEPENIDFDPRKSAVCVIDMQNWDIKPGGLFDLTGVDTTHGQKVIEPIRTVLFTARAASIPVIYTENVISRARFLRPDESSPWYWKGNWRKLERDPSLERGMCMEGSWAAKTIEELAPMEGDIVIQKDRYSGFVRTNLDWVLRSKDIRYLFFAGIGTPTCVEATARDAFFHEYWPIVLADCCGAISKETHEQALFAIKRRYGWVTSSEHFLNALRAGM